MRSVVRDEMLDLSQGSQNPGDLPHYAEDVLFSNRFCVHAIYSSIVSVLRYTVLKRAQVSNCYSPTGSSAEQSQSNSPHRLSSTLEHMSIRVSSLGNVCALMYLFDIHDICS
jgi:hypothetical protein